MCRAHFPIQLNLSEFLIAENAPDRLQFYKSIADLPTAGTLSANAGEPEAKRAMLTAPATVTILFISFCAGFGNDHDCTVATLATTTTSRRRNEFILRVNTTEMARRNSLRIGEIHSSFRNIRH